MEYSWSLAEDSGGGGNADATERAPVAGGQRLIIDARRLPHQTPGVTYYSPCLLFVHCIIMAG
jgi:hypothetical protein